MIIPARTINYGSIDPTEARALFIRAALVRGQYGSPAPFLTHNRTLIDEIEQLEHKARRLDVLVNEQHHFEFYDERVPRHVCDRASFERWRLPAEQRDPRLLYMTREYLMRHDATGVTAERFPEHLSIDGMKLALSYRFEPGHPADGVSATVPLLALNQLRPEQFEWLVPGLLREKIAALLKTLPKPLRRHFLPASDYADACSQALTDSTQPLLPALTRVLARMAGAVVPAESWHAEALPAHLRMNFRLVDGDDREVAMSRDLVALQSDFGARVQRGLTQRYAPKLERVGVTEWDFGDLPERIELEGQSRGVYAYPALAEEGSVVSLRLHDSLPKAQAAMRVGLRRLLMLRLAPRLRYVRKNLPHIQQMCLCYVPLGSCEQLREDLLALIVDRACIGDDIWVRDARQFDARVQRGHAELMPTAAGVCETVRDVLTSYHDVAQRLNPRAPPGWQEALADMREQLNHLIWPGFLQRIPYTRLLHLPRYLKAMRLRLDKLEKAPDKDRSRQAAIAPLWQLYLAATTNRAHEDARAPALRDYRWMLEELRVSLFAQELGTAVPVSVKRLHETWSEIEAKRTAATGRPAIRSD